MQLVAVRFVGNSSNSEELLMRVPCQQPLSSLGLIHNDLIQHIARLECRVRVLHVRTGGERQAYEDATTLRSRQASQGAGVVLDFSMVAKLGGLWQTAGMAQKKITFRRTTIARAKAAVKRHRAAKKKRARSRPERQSPKQGELSTKLNAILDRPPLRSAHSATENSKSR